MWHPHDIYDSYGFKTTIIQITHWAPAKQKNEHGSDEKLVLKEVAGTEDEAQERTRAKRNMENKARLYAAMQVATPVWNSPTGSGQQEAGLLTKGRWLADCQQ